MSNRFNLLIEKPDTSDFEYLIEEKNSKDKGSMYIKGPYMVCEVENKNNRVYPREEMEREVKRYISEMIEPKRAMGELNHPTSAEVDLERACHMVTSLEQDDNVFYGKSKVLSTPTGLIVQSLIRDGCSLGMSTRSLGKLVNSEERVNTVKDMRLVAIDCVADPSYPKAFVNGILESKRWVCNEDGSFCELYEDFEDCMCDLPKKDVEQYLQEQVITFINKIKEKQ